MLNKFSFPCTTHYTHSKREIESLKTFIKQEIKGALHQLEKRWEVNLHCACRFMNILISRHDYIKKIVNFLIS